MAQWYVVRAATLAVIIGALAAPFALAADEPDLIFRKSTVFHWVSPNDKLATYAIDDPAVDGVACHFTVPEKGGFKGWIGVAEEVSDISLACRQIGPVKFKTKFEQGDDVFRGLLGTLRLEIQVRDQDQSVRLRLLLFGNRKPLSDLRRMQAPQQRQVEEILLKGDAGVENIEGRRGQVEARNPGIDAEGLEIDGLAVLRNGDIQLRQEPGLRLADLSQSLLDSFLGN